MKKLIVFVCLFIYQSIWAMLSNAQNGIITTVAGTPHDFGFSGDGGPATSAKFRYPEAVTFDAIGNMYITDYSNHRIRKISPTGIISTFAGSGTPGFSGDGGPATAARLNYPVGLAIDGGGNIYCADASNNRIRKIAPSGIITTVAGNGATSFSGDGGPATAASMHWPCGVAVDGSGNIYIADFDNNRIRKVNSSGIISTFAGSGFVGYGGDGGAATVAQLHRPYGVTVSSAGDIYIADYENYVIRKVNTSNIITTFAGNGTYGFSGDGGPATAAQFRLPQGIVFDGMGNSYVVDMSNHRIRKINALGIISTVAGNGTIGYSGDGGLATLAELDSPAALAFDGNNNLYIPEFGNHIIRKIQFAPDHVSDSFSVYLSNTCSGMEFTLLPKPSSTATSIRTFFGDGSSNTSSITVGSTLVSHVYANPGVYTVRHILYNGTIPLDTLRYSHTFLLCNVFPLGFYFDGNSNCIKDPTENFNFRPLLVKVDSNGITIDTISATSGVNYIAYGYLGDVYSFKVISADPGLTTTCPVSGTVLDTLQPAISGKLKGLGMSCSSVPGHDLRVFTSFRAGVHHYGGTIFADNTYCTPSAATLTMQLSPKYTTSLHFTPTPTSISGNLITWNISSLSSVTTKPYLIQADMEKTPGVLLPLGDTVITRYNIDPITGDGDPTNNMIIRTDTVQSGYDPNDIAVNPSGCLAPGITTLTYTVRFENTGNDTAFNIYVLDTLPNQLDPKSLRIVATSAAMDISINKISGYNIVKFDFPNIKLLDSSHHGLNTGMLVYSINMMSGLGSGTVIPNRAGIYFDDNPVVLTNTVNNEIGCPTNVKDVYNSNSFDVYPNPATDQLTIKTDNDTYTSLSISNTVGQQLLQQPFSTSQTIVDVKMLPAGLYYIMLRGEQGSVVKKFVKM